MTDRDATLDAIAARHGFGRGAVLALAEALRRGGGRMAQFSHPELGGMGQWSGGGMLQIGTLFDHALKARVAAALADLAAAEPDARDVAASTAADPWPAELGRPSATGAQGGLRYACFPEARRLVILSEGRVTVYDTGSRRISGVSQSRSRDARVAFMAEDGPVDLDDLRVVGSEVLTPS